ncbi:MAG: hypothetical protein H0U86_15040 [Chloroflexi bacterium]|nr:hypothetical protein [Chloroflexota bacterium]
MNETEARDPVLEPVSDDDGGPPVGTAWTLLVNDGDEGWSADLEHAAPLPRVGERIEFIGEDGGRRHFRVTQVTHTLQTAASERPRVGEERTGPNSIVTDGSPDEPPRLLRAGLPRVLALRDEEP